jgi:hypothetical protein
MWRERFAQSTDRQEVVEMERFVVQIYYELSDSEPFEEQVIRASDHRGAAAKVLLATRIGRADWIRVERQGQVPSVVCYLDACCSPTGRFSYEAIYG